MTLPDYKRPFEPSDFRGYFTWTKKLSDKLIDDHLYHACHYPELMEIIKKRRLNLRSKWSINLPEHGICDVLGVWCGLNYFANGNHYGPFLIKFPLTVLEGKQFIAFRRGSKSERNRYFFVQYDALVPIYSFRGNIWRRVDAESYFIRNKNSTLSKIIGGIYDIVLTRGITLNEQTSILSVDHNKCIPGKCRGSNKITSHNKLREFAKDILKKEIKNTGVIDRIIQRYPDVAGEVLEIEID